MSFSGIPLPVEKLHSCSLVLQENMQIQRSKQNVHPVDQPRLVLGGQPVRFAAARAGGQPRALLPRWTSRTDSAEPPSCLFPSVCSRWEFSILGRGLFFFFFLTLVVIKGVFPPSLVFTKL